jgi:FAD/FMN-containing dehydrogenase
MQGELTRRRVLAGLAAAVAFDPIGRSWSSARAQSSIQVPDLDGELTLDPAALSEAADDFGHIVHRQPLAVLRPGSIRDVQRMIRFAQQHGISVSMRGQGHSTYGQAQAQAGVVIDSRSLNQIESVSPGGVWVGPGVVWIDLLQATLASGLTPPVLTDYIGLSVGGTLSVGGIGGATHRHGFQVDNVLELEVVTGTGERRICSPTQHPFLFQSVLAGLGQFAIIVRAKLKLIAAQASARVYRLSYDDLQSFLDDQRIALEDERFDYLEGQISLLPDGGSSFMLEAASYYTSPDAPDDAALLAGLTPLASVVEEHTYFDWSNRLAGFVAFLQSTGAWDLPHPWLDLFLPDQAAEEFIGAALATLTLATTGGGPLLCYPFKRAKSTRPFLALPESETVFIFDVLRFADPTTVQDRIEDNRRLFESARQRGGKRYPVSSVPTSPADWILHFGARYPLLVAAKAAFDPDNVLTRGQGIFNRQP